MDTSLITCCFCDVTLKAAHPGIKYVTNKGGTICSDCVEICHTVIHDDERHEQKAARRRAFASGSLVALPVKRG